MTDRARLSSGERLLLAGFLVVGFLLRLIPWGRTFVGDQVLFQQNDAYYHLRRAALILRDFPSLSGVDLYVAFPNGSESPWPPLYDLAVASISLLFGGTSRSIEIVSAILPALLGALSVVPLYRFTRRLFGVGAACSASLLFLLAVESVRIGSVGQGDHHAAEALMLLLFADLSTAAFLGPPRSVVRTAVAPALALSAAVLVWQGAVLFAAVLVGASLLHDLGSSVGWGSRSADGDVVLRTSAVAAASLLLAAGVCAVVRTVVPASTPQGVMDFGFFSYFQPLLLLSLSGVAAIPAARRSFEGAPRRRFAAVGLAVSAFLLPLVVPSFRDGILSGLSFLTVEDDWLASIAERKSLLVYGWGGEFPSVRWVYGLALPTAVILAPAIAAFLAARSWRRGTFSPSEAFFAVLVVLFGGLTLWQVRWLVEASAFIASALGGGVAVAVSALPAAGEGLRRFFSPSSWAGAFRTLLVAVATTTLVWSGMAGPVFGGRDDSPDLDFRAALTWLREGTPAPSDPYDSADVPSYSVLAFWPFGHWINWIGERPTVADGFGNQFRGGGLEDSMRALLTTEGEELAEICERRRVRYLVTSEMFGYMAHMAAPLGRLARVDFEREFVDVAPGQDGPKKRPKPAFLSIASTRLHAFEGAASPYGPAMSRFRLVFESATPDPFYEDVAPWVRRVKVFEFVRGARVEGRAAPGAEVALVVPLAGPDGRRFRYLAVGRADSAGTYRLVSPYATLSPNGAVRVAGKAQVGPVDRPPDGVDISEVDVVEGRVVRVR